MDVTKVEFCCEKKGSRTMKQSKFSEEQIIGIHCGLCRNGALV